MILGFTIYPPFTKIEKLAATFTGVLSTEPSAAVKSLTSDDNFILSPRASLKASTVIASNNFTAGTFKDKFNEFTKVELYVYLPSKFLGAHFPKATKSFTTTV